MIVKYLKVVGVQFAANPEHVRGEEMCEKEKLRTIELLTSIDKERPRMRVVSEHENGFDLDCFAVKWGRKHCGYLRYKAEVKAVAHAALVESGKEYFRAQVSDVMIAENGYFRLVVQLEHDPMECMPCEDLWSKWDMEIPPLRPNRQEMDYQDALMMLSDVLDEQDPDPEELQEYAEGIIRLGRHSLCRESKLATEQLISRLEGVDGMHAAASELDHLLSGMCNQRREIERRDMWWPSVLASEEAQEVIRTWRNQKDIYLHQASNLELTELLTEIEAGLMAIPTLASPDLDDEVLLLARAYYTGIPEAKWRKLLSALILRRWLRQNLNMPLGCKISTKGVLLQDELRFIGSMVKYAEGLPNYDEVKVLQTFIYKHIDHLPSQFKQIVDGMTDRFKATSDLLNNQTHAIHEQATALQEVAKKKTIGTLVLEQNNHGVNAKELENNDDPKLLNNG